MFRFSSPRWVRLAGLAVVFGCLAPIGYAQTPISQRFSPLTLRDHMPPKPPITALNNNPFQPEIGLQPEFVYDILTNTSGGLGGGQGGLGGGLGGGGLGGLGGGGLGGLGGGGLGGGGLGGLGGGGLGGLGGGGLGGLGGGLGGGGLGGGLGGGGLGGGGFGGLLGGGIRLQNDLLQLQLRNATFSTPVGVPPVGFGGFGGNFSGFGGALGGTSN
jgi:hypothetical protein